MAGHLAAQEVCEILISTINECRVSSEGRCQHLNKLLRSMPLLRLDCGVEQHLCAAGSPCREEDPAGADQQASLQLYIRDRVQDDIEAGMDPARAARKHAGIKAEFTSPPPAITFSVRELDTPHKHGVLGMDLQLCGPLACSEVRAALAAECADSWHPWLQRDCTRSRALQSTCMVFPDLGRTCVEQVFHRCYGSDLGENPVPELVAPAQSSDRSGHAGQDDGIQSGDARGDEGR